MPKQIEENLVLTFESVNFTMQGEKHFEENNLELKIIPTPREISSSCGLSILTSIELIDEIRKLEKETGMRIANYWRFIKNEDGSKEVSLIED